MASLVAVGECCYFGHNKELWVIGAVHVRVSDWLHQAQEVSTAVTWR